MKIGIIGTGMFGFALARYLGEKYSQDDDVSIMTYDKNKTLITHLQQHRKHLYHFRDKKLAQKIVFTTDKTELVHGADTIILAIVSRAIREVVREIRDHLKSEAVVVNTAKALESQTGKTLYEVAKEELNGIAKRRFIAKLSGGTFAEDLVNDAPLGVDIACESLEVLDVLQKVFRSHTLRVYGNTDVLGTEYAGAFKNVIAILAGIVNGLELPYGSETHMISRAAKEAKEIAVAMGAKTRTFSMESQCWGNDLWMSCTGRSRNREFGRLIGVRLPPREALDKLQKNYKTVEGYYTVEAIPELCMKANVRAPIFSEIYKMIYEEKEPEKSIDYLMRRKDERLMSEL